MKTMIAFTLPVLAMSLNLQFEEDKNRPVSRVIKLLKEMMTQLEKDQTDDEEIYNKMNCWCKTNDKEKTQSIKDAEIMINQLTAKIESLAGHSARLETEIDDLNKEISANNIALDKAVALREKQLADYNAESKDMVQSIQSLKSAITVLSKHHSSMIQEDKLANISALISELKKRHPEAVDVVQSRKLNTFLQAPTNNAQSGEIFGILQNMKETFEANLKTSEEEEKANGKSFAQLKAAKMEEINAAQEQADKKSMELANAQSGHAEAKKSREDTEESLSADQQFLMSLKEKCALSDQEWTARQQARQEEIVAVSQAIGVLSNDDARDNFTKVYNFIQVDNKYLRSLATTMLSNTAKRYHNPKIAQLASNAKLDAFTKVKQAIDGMVEQLKQEKEDEVKHKDWCVNEFHDNEKNTNKAARDREDEEARIDQLQSTISHLGDLLKKIEEEQKELKVNLSKAGEDREKQNAEFQKVVRDQREAQTSLNKAMQFLQNFYEKKAAAPAGPGETLALIQDEPKGFSNYKKGAGNSVIMLLQQIIADTQAMEKEMIHDEQESQKSYEEFVIQTNKSIEAKENQHIDTAGDRAQSERELGEAQSNHAGLLIELEQLSHNKADVHKSCDFVMKNFDIRQQARDEEIDGLHEAKAILSGAKFKGFLQQ